MRGLIFVGIVLLAVACNGGGEALRTATPKPSPALTAIATPTAGPATQTPLTTPTPAAGRFPGVIDGVDVVGLRVGEETELPDNAALVIETGCWGCDGPAESFLRVYRDPSGHIRTDTLLTIDDLGLPPRLVTTAEGMQEEPPSITGFATRPDGSEMVVSVCVREFCGSGGLDAWSPNSKTAFFRSTDGGVTWQEFGELDVGSSVIGFVREGVVLVSSWQAEMAPAYFSLFPSGETVQTPSGVTSWWAFPLPGGDLLWPADDGRLLHSDGSVFAVVPTDPWRLSWVPRINHDPTGTRFTLEWVLDNAGSPSYQVRHYIGIFRTDSRLEQAFSLSELLFVGPWSGPDLLGNIAISASQLTTPIPQSFAGTLPTLIDLDAGLIHPITDPFLGSDWKGGRSLVRAVFLGPFARVVDTGSCLNVRAEPGSAAEVLACAADGVLLRDMGETQETDGMTWLRVVTPAGVEGWVSRQYLQEQ
ncbi:MAG: SH3 domain-containing protein [Dehalococcoidia bacterium]|nr:MAG: SH3 domain-containing protein [Dehalococcoidia bacterium]